MGTLQTFKTADVLKLEVEQTPTGLVNLIQNNRGLYGGWGWLTPVANSRLGKFGGTNTLGGIIYNGPSTGGPSWFTTEELPISAGQYAAAYLPDAGPSAAGDKFRIRFEWLDANKALLSSSTQSGYYSGTGIDGPISYAATVAPAGTAYVRLRFDIYANTSGGNPPANDGFTVDRATVAKASTAAALSGLGALEPATYTDVLGSAHSINVKRDELSVSTLTAEILNAAYDPALVDLIRPGKRVRLMALDASVTPNVFTPLFTGKINSGATKYDPTRTDAKRARITLTAFDNTAAMAGVKRPLGVAAISQLPNLFEGAGIPWNVNGSGGQITGLSYVSWTADTTLIDQVAITRDSNLGYAWVDRRGVVNVWDRASLPSSVVATLNESVYSGLDLDYDTDRCINTVGVKLRYQSGWDTQEVTYGPFVDAASVAKWGPHAAEFTVHGIANTSAAASAYAAPILTANATPAVRVNSVTIPIRNAADVIPGRALLDLYDLVTVANTNAGISQNMRPTALEHRIEDGSWLLELDFTVTGSVATPQVTPSLAVPSGQGLGENRGTFTGTTDGTGKVLIPHGLAGTPTFLAAQDQNSGHYAAPANPDATNFQVFIRNLTTAGAPVITGASVVVFWQAHL